MSVPVNIGYSQSLFGFNSLKWQRRIEPLRYEEARKSYVETMELVSARRRQVFRAGSRHRVTTPPLAANLAYADTLYRFAKGRYEDRDDYRKRDVAT